METELMETLQPITTNLSDEKLQQIIDLIHIQVIDPTTGQLVNVNLLEKIYIALQYLCNIFFLFMVVSVSLLILYILYSCVKPFFNHY